MLGVLPPEMTEAGVRSLSLTTPAVFYNASASCSGGITEGCVEIHTSYTRISVGTGSYGA